MAYIISSKWGGMHGDVVLRRSEEELLYVLKGIAAPGRRDYAVTGPSGEQVFRVYRPQRFFGSAYEIRSEGQTVAQIGSNWCHSRGHIRAIGLPVIRCKFGWGLRHWLSLMGGPDEIARVTIQKGVGLQGKLLIKTPAFREPHFLVGCALLFHDWTKRG